MADFISFDEGANYLLGGNAIPATCYFLLSSRQVGPGSGTLFTAADTLAGGVGEITGTGYSRKSQARPAAASRALAFTQMSWATASASDWPSVVRAVVLVTTADNTGKAICAWNLLTGGTARDLSQPNTTENFTPTLTL
jgi:hypothetical protein